MHHNFIVPHLTKIFFSTQYHNVANLNCSWKKMLKLHGQISDQKWTQRPKAFTCHWSFCCDENLQTNRASKPFSCVEYFNGFQYRVNQKKSTSQLLGNARVKTYSSYFFFHFAHGEPEYYYLSVCLYIVRDVSRNRWPLRSSNIRSDVTTVIIESDIISCSWLPSHHIARIDFCAAASGQL